MHLTTQSLLCAHPGVKSFLGAIVDSAEIQNLAPSEREGMIRELGALFKERLALYLEKTLGRTTLARLEGAATLDDAAMYARLREEIPTIDSDLEQLRCAFHAEYSVTKGA